MQQGYYQGQSPGQPITVDRDAKIPRTLYTVPNEVNFVRSPGSQNMEVRAGGSPMQQPVQQQQQQGTPAQFVESQMQQGSPVPQTQVEQQSGVQVPADLYQAVQEFLSNKYSTISNERLLDPETWCMYRSEFENLSAFRANIEAQKRAICDACDRELSYVSRLLNELKTRASKRLDDLYQPYHEDYNAFKADVNTYCDKARAILSEERTRLVAEVRTSIKDSWTAQSLREEFSIVDRNCESADVNRATSIVLGVRDASNILQNARRIHVLQGECAAALNIDGIRGAIQQVNEVFRQVGLESDELWVRNPFPDHPRVPGNEVKIEEFQEQAQQHVIRRSTGTEETVVRSPEVTTVTGPDIQTSPGPTYITRTIHNDNTAMHTSPVVAEQEVRTVQSPVRVTAQQSQHYSPREQHVIPPQDQHQYIRRY